MSNHDAIRCISHAMNRVPVGDAGEAVLADIGKAYPYFVPARYCAAQRRYRERGYGSGLLADMRPYEGNWLLFCDYVQGQDAEPAAAEAPVAAAAEQVAEPVALPEAEPAMALAAPEEVVVAAAELTLVDSGAAAAAETEDAEAEEVAPAEPVAAGAEHGTDSQAGSEEANLITPLVSYDYFLLKGEKITDEIGFELSDLKKEEPEPDKALMVVMSFTEWLLHFKHAADKHKEETKEQKALKTMWQKEKLAAAMEEENEEIPENVFEMAVNSISREEGMASETLADIYIKQGKYDQAADMYRKLSLLNPQKSTYFARKTEEALKNKQT